MSTKSATTATTAPSPSRTWHIVSRFGSNDAYEPPLHSEDRVLYVPFGASGSITVGQTANEDSMTGGQPSPTGGQGWSSPQTHIKVVHQVHHTLQDTFAREGIVPSVTVIDLLAAAITVYAADVRVPRRDAFDGWTRDFVLHLAVASPGLWAPALPVLERLLAFLTGDHWRLTLRPLPTKGGDLERTWLGTTSTTTLTTPPPSGSLASPDMSQVGLGTTHLTVRPGQPRLPGQRAAARVCLFSGGLDSYIGAIDQAARGDMTVLVGHHGSGQGPTSVAQRSSSAAFAHSYGPEVARFVRLWVSPPSGVGSTGASEITTRSRSILFLALGLAVADGTGARELIVPENGVISLNVPLTPARLGSMSTRTTHPHLIHLLRELLALLGLEVAVALPYRFRTKGEMLRDCANQEALRSGLAATMSCAHPGAQRFSGVRRANLHCGYCLPCLIRRAAITAALDEDPTEYAFADLREVDTIDRTHSDRGADLRACRLALGRYAATAPQLTDLLRAGPLPGTSAEQQAYLGVFRRGLDELRQFLARTG